MTGYRVGWTRCSSYVAAQLTKIQEPLVSCASPFNQIAAAAALDGPQDCVERMRGEYRLRRDTALGILKSRGRVSSYVPGGAFYLPVDITSSGKKRRKKNYQLGSLLPDRSL
jgi:aspartate/methionine/tyrosine aminotransferase